MATVKLGDKVKVFDINGHRHGQPEAGWDGEVVKVGTKLVTIAYRRSRQVFRLATGVANDDYGHQVFMALPEARRHVALQALSSRGLQPASWARHDIDYLEAVADALRGLPNPRF